MSDFPELAILTNRYLDGELQANEVERLNELLRQDPQARKEFAERLNLDAAVSQAVEFLNGEPLPAVDEPSGPRPRGRVRSMAVASACLGLAAILWSLWSLMASPSALVVRSAGAVELREGAAVRNERCRLKAGSVELLTSRGVRMVIEAPAEFQFLSAQELVFHRGRISAHVAESARGFTVLTPTGKVIDLGTEFGVEVSPEGNSELHVFEGEVIARPKSGTEERLLTTNEAFQFVKEGMGAACDMRSGSFLRADEMEQLVQGLRAGQIERNQSCRDRLRRDPTLLAWLDFEPASASQSKAVVRGPRSVQGRFPGTTAIDFVDRTDRVELDLNVQVPQFTFLAWVRLNHVNWRNNSLYSTDEWGKLGQVHWMTGRDAMVRFAIKSDILQPIRPGQSKQDSNLWAESRALSPDRLHRWLNLAVVYDSVAGEAALYLDGRREMSASMPKGLLAALGPAQIGNWKPVPWFKDEGSDRRLSGRIDEFAAFARAFSADEIAEYFEHSTPYR